MNEEEYIFVVWFMHNTPLCAHDIHNDNLRKAFGIIEEEYDKMIKDRKKKRPLQEYEMDAINKIVYQIYERFVNGVINLDRDCYSDGYLFYKRFEVSRCCEGCRFLKKYNNNTFCVSRMHCDRCNTVDAYLTKKRLVDTLDEWFDLFFEHFLYNKISVESFYNLLDYSKLTSYDRNRKLGRDIRTILDRQILEDITNSYGKRIIRFITNYKKRYERAFLDTIKIESTEG